MGTIRQQPLITEEEFMEAIAEANNNEDTVFVQWRPDMTDENSPEVVTAENFIWYEVGPNDAWWFIENGQARGWKKFPNLEERNLPWENG